MTDQPHIPTQFTAPDFGLERSVETDVPMPPELVAAIEAHPDQHDFAAAAPERDEEAAADTPAAAAPPSGPEPLAAGTYAVYDDGKGGYVLVLGTREGETHHKHLPSHIVKMAMKMSGGNNPLTALLGA